MPSEALQLADLLGPTWKHALLLGFVVVFLLGLLVERLWLLRELKRDVSAIKEDLPRMERDIRRAQRTADEAKHESERTAAAVGQAQVIDRLHEAVLELPQTIVTAMARGGGR